KYARYLEEAQTPEWKKAYINYRALKKDISALKRAQEGLVQIEPTADPVASPSPATFHVALSPIDSPHPYVFFPGDRPLTTEPLETTPSTGRRTRDYVDVPQDDNYVASDDAAEIQTEARDHVPSIESSTHYGTARSHFTSQASSLMRRMTNRLPRMPRRGTGFSLHDAIHRLHTPEPFAAVPSYAVLLTLLSPAELAFFDMLDAERAKIETFYLAREKELQDRTTQLRGQLHELIDHRRLIEALARSSCTTAALPQSIRLRISALKPSLLPAAGQSASTLIEQRDEADPEKGLPRTFGHKREWSSASSTHRRNMLDPDDFHNAKRSLKKAVTEHYRALELLQNYRILNITGFRKALKKFQKVTKIPCSDLYMREKVDNSAFASDSNIKQMMTEMESLYAACFAEGDKKRATARLRAATEQKTHHFSTFRTGLTIGVSLPPLALGIYQAAATQDSFADFWMGDQICSLVFSLSNVYVVPCIYATDFDEDWREHCMAESSEWPVLFAIGTIPFFVRAIQSTKRYFDTGKVIQLANAGKYGLGIITYLIYFRWRHEGEWSGPYYIAYIVLATLYSIIACGWDFVMDWSILNPKASTFMLRDELLYGRVYYYYVAMLFNFIGRFAWIFYVIETGPDFLLRSFVVGVIEVTRRWVWNFCRLENEHIGNVDQYRATREIPLPYWLEEDIDSEEARRA
ncbi:EXS family-domain-containing protein, partial [Schizophyllum fasciatum]